MKRHINVLNCGGGRQSSALVLMVCEGLIDAPDIVIMADTGWEREQTMSYWHEVLVPAMDRAGIPHEIVQRIHTHESMAGQVGNIREDALRSVREGTRVANAPFFVDMGMQPCTHRVKGVKVTREIGTCEMHPKGKDTKGKLGRKCTGEMKITPITKRVRELLGMRPGQRWDTKKYGTFTATNWIGIATEESKRANGNSGNDSITLVYPLIEMGMSTADCIEIIENLGYPVPVKSACVGCPFRSLQSWARMRRDDPTSFADAVDFDEKLRWPFGMGRLNDGQTERDYREGNEPSKVKGAKYPAYLLSKCIPLGEIELPQVDEDASESFGGEC
jgi:hypothetical protein